MPAPSEEARPGRSAVHQRPKAGGRQRREADEAVEPPEGAPAALGRDEVGDERPLRALPRAPRDRVDAEDREEGERRRGSDEGEGA